MNKTEVLRRLDRMSEFYFLIEERDYTREEAARAVGLDFNPDEMDSMKFTLATEKDSNEAG